MVWASTQKAHDLFQMLTALLGLDESRLRVATPDVGGGFGPKLCVYSEDIAVVAAAKLLQRPVKWVEDRREHFTNAAQERDQYWSLDIAVDADGTVLGIRGTLLHDLGAYALQDVNLPYNSASMITGPYMVPALAIDISVAATNKAPVSSIRGAGYPQATFAMERLLDRVARKLDLDRAELRRRNLIPPEKMPYTKPLTARSGAPMRYDSGDYPACQAEVLAAAGWDDFPQRQAAARAQGRYIGIGLANAIKGTGRGPFESGMVRVSNTGRVSVHTGAAAIGQGLGTILAQICAGELGLKPEDITVVPGDTAGVSLGLGAFASRQTVTAGSSVLLAARAVAGKAKKLASHVLEAAEHDLELVDGEVRVVGAPGLSVKLAELSRILKGAPGYGYPPGIEPGLEANVNWRTDALAYANTCHAAEVEVDIETGGVRVVQLRGDAGLRHADQPDAGRGPGAGRHRARARQRAVGMDGLRRQRPAGDHHVRGLSAARRARGADDHGAVQADAVAAQSARRQGRGRGQHHPGRRRDHRGDRGCAAAVRRAHRADADHAREARRTDPRRNEDLRKARRAHRVARPLPACGRGEGQVFENSTRSPDPLPSGRGVNLRRAHAACASRGPRGALALGAADFRARVFGVERERREKPRHHREVRARDVREQAVVDAAQQRIDVAHRRFALRREPHQHAAPVVAGWPAWSAAPCRSAGRPRW